MNSQQRITDTPLPSFRDVVLPRPLQDGEFFCHPCGKFLQMTESDEHRRYHTLRARMLALQGVMIVCLVLTSTGLRAQTLADQFPEAPQPVKQSQYGGYEVDKTKLPKRAPLFTKTWVGAHTFYLGAIVFDAEMTHQGLAHHKCQEMNIDLGRRPSRGDLYRNNLLEEYLPLTAMDLLFQGVWRGDKSPKSWEWVPLIGPGYGSVVHLRGGSSWLTRGCW